MGGEVYAFSEISDHMSMLREFYAHFLDMSPGMVGFEDCDSHFTHLANKKTITGKFLFRHFLAIQKAIELQGLGNV